MTDTYTQIKNELILFYFFYSRILSNDSSNFMSLSDYSKLVKKISIPLVDIKTIKTNCDKLVTNCRSLTHGDTSCFNSAPEHFFYNRIVTFGLLQPQDNFYKEGLIPTTYYPLVIGLVSALNKGSQNNWKNLEIKPFLLLKLSFINYILTL